MGAGNVLKRERFEIIAPDEEKPHDDSEEEQAPDPRFDDVLAEPRKKLPEIEAEDFDGDKLYDPSSLMEEVDPIVGIKSVEYAQCHRNEERNVIKEDSEFAIIGYWQLKDNGVFRCVHSFTVPNPMKREVDDVGGTNLYSFLYPGKNGEVFFFYEEKNQKRTKDNGLFFCVLDTASDQLEKKKGLHGTGYRRQSTIKRADDQSIKYNCDFMTKIPEGCILDKYVRDYNTMDTPDQKQLPNPTLIERDNVR
jgi:hypothetical protein